MRKVWGGVILAAGMILASGASAEVGYLQIKGQKQGDFKGEITSKGHENTMEVVALGYKTSTPVSAAGVPSGRRTQTPITFTLRWSKTTPLLLGALTGNENLPYVKYQGFGAKPDGTQANLHEITLTNARVVSVEILDKNGEENTIDPLVVVALSYQKLELTHVDGGITILDDWSAAN